MKAPTALTRKAGPLPVYAWAALVLVAGFLYLRSRNASAGAPSTPVLPATGSGAQQPASGQGTPADNMNGDLLSALMDNQAASYDAILSALQYGGAAGGGFGGSSVPAGFGSTAGPSAAAADTSAFTAETVDSGVNNAPAPVPNYLADSSSGGVIDQYTTASSGLPVGTPTVDAGFWTVPDTTPDALDRYLANQADTSSRAPSVSAPTPTVVQPAPVTIPGTRFVAA